MLVLTAADVSSVFTMGHAVEAAKEAAALHVAGRSVTPRRHQLATTQPAGEMLVMPGVVDGATFGMKLWYRFERPSGSIPGSSAAVLLLDAEHGEEVLLDGAVITDLRTGALTGVAAAHLARPDSEVAAILGAGIQARTQVLALVEALPGLRQVRVASRSAERLRSFVRRMSEELDSGGVGVESTATARDAVEGADVVVAATTATRPVIEDGWVKDGALVCGVGSHDPESSEIPAATVGRAERVVVDTIAGAVDGAGDVAHAIRDGLLDRADVVELGALVAGTATGRTGPDGVTVFKSVGFAGADIVSATTVVELAIRAGAGTRLDLHRT